MSVLANKPASQLLVELSTLLTEAEGVCIDPEIGRSGIMSGERVPIKTWSQRDQAHALWREGLMLSAATVPNVVQCLDSVQSLCSLRI